MLMHFNPNLLRLIKAIIVKALRGQSSLVMPDLIRHQDRQTLWKDTGFSDKSESSSGRSLSRIIVRGRNDVSRIASQPTNC